MQASQNSNLQTQWYDLGEELRKLTKTAQNLYQRWIDQTRRFEKQEHLKDLEDLAEEVKRTEEERLRDVDAQTATEDLGDIHGSCA